MKFCKILIDGNPRVCAKTDTGIVDLTAGGFPASMNEFIAGGNTMLAQAADFLQTNPSTTLSEDSVKFLPVTEPEKIVCEGLNYKSHAEETGAELPENPIFFSKFGDALSAHGDSVSLPAWHQCYDHEAELVIVIGKRAYNVSVEEAGEYIFGYTCGNDLSERASQRLSSQWLSGKSLPGFAPVGPYIATSDSFDPYEGKGIYCEVNGKTVQSGNTSDLIFPCHETVSAASRFFPLNPGDLIFTGTPAGVILGRPQNERNWLKPGDIVKVTIEGLGTLVTPLV